MDHEGLEPSGGFYFYLVELKSSRLNKLDCTSVSIGTYAPCFINGENEFVAIGDMNGTVEVWSVQERRCVKGLRIGERLWTNDLRDEGRTSITAMASTNNILAVSAVMGYIGESRHGTLQLWDVRSWDMFHSTTFDEILPNSRYLTTDLKYLTIAGWGGCVVMEVQ